MARRNKPTIDDELIDNLLEGREHSAALLGNDGLIGELKKRLAERMLSAEMDVHPDNGETAGYRQPPQRLFAEIGHHGR
jgi:putative transposase